MTSHDLFAIPRAASAHPAAIKVGIGGWNFAPWRKNFYPDGLPQRRELEFASRQLPAIEINSTYYGAQKPATYARWAEQTPEGFVFSLKAPRYVVEMRQLAEASKAATGFIQGGLEELGDRLGPIVWQLAPRRVFDADDLARFLDRLPRELAGRPLRHVLEVRHPSFQDKGYLDLARQHRIPTVFTDSADYPSMADITGDFIYARLMCSQESHPNGYAPAQLKAWAHRARQWADGHDNADLPHVLDEHPETRAREVFIYFISAAKPRNPAAAQALLTLLDT